MPVNEARALGQTSLVVHGDLKLLQPAPHARQERRPALLDWDEARVDVSTLDEVALAQVTRRSELRHARARPLLPD